MNNMWKPSDLAKELNVSTQTILRWIRIGRIKAIRLPSGTYRILEEEVQKIKGKTNE